MTSKTFLKMFSLIFIIFLLVSCSGGGGGVTSNTDSTSTTGTTGSTGSTGSTSTKATLSGTVYTSKSSSGGGTSLKPGLRNKSYAASGSSDKIPVSGANILLFDLDSTSTAAKETTTTDSTGKYSIETDPGHFIIFAVYLDLSSFTLKVARVDDINAEAGDKVSVDDQVVATDTASPTIESILDDTIASSGTNQDVYEPSPIPSSSKISVNFNESMSRSSLEEDGIITLKNESDADVPYTLEGNGSLTEFRLVPTTALTEGATYTLTISKTVKDLANNQLGVNAVATIKILTKEESSQPFSVLYTKPGDESESVPVSAPLTMIFNYPADFSSFKDNLVVDPSITGRIEIKGKTATFFPKERLQSEKKYEVTLKSGIKDLSGDTLGQDYNFSFTTSAPLTTSTNPDDIAIADVVGKFQAAMDSGNFSSLLSLMTPDFTAEDFDHEKGGLINLDAKSFIEMLNNNNSKQMGFGEIHRVAIAEKAAPDNHLMVEHYKNSNGYDLYRGFVPIQWAHPDEQGNLVGDIIDVQKEVTDQFTQQTRMEHFTYLLSGGRFDPANTSSPRYNQGYSCETGEVTASIPQFDDHGMQLRDETTGEQLMTEHTFTVVDGDCDSVNSWIDANDHNPGNNPWPQDGDDITTNDPIPFNDSQLTNKDQILTNDEIWSTSESYFVVDANGEFQGIGPNSDLIFKKIVGPKSWPCPHFSQNGQFQQNSSPVMDNNADGECDGDSDSGYDLARVFVDSDGNAITSWKVLQDDYFSQQKQAPFKFKVIGSGLTVPVGEMFDLDADWQKMKDQESEGSDGQKRFDPNAWTKILKESTDAVIETYYLTSVVKMSIDNAISLYPPSAPTSGSAFVNIEITDTWSPHPPYDPNHPENADLNGDGKVDDNDNSFTHNEFRQLMFKKIADVWYLAKIGMTGSGGPQQGDGGFHDMRNPIIPISPAPHLNDQGMPSGPAENIGVNPVFEWSFEKFPTDVTVGSVILFILEMGEPTSTTPPEPQNVHVRVFSGNPTSYTYGSDVGTDITVDVINKIGSDTKDDFPIKDPTKLIPTDALENGKAYMWTVMAFKESPETLLDNKPESIGESFMMLFATTTLPDGFKQQPIIGNHTKMSIR